MKTYRSKLLHIALLLLLVLYNNCGRSGFEVKVSSRPLSSTNSNANTLPESAQQPTPTPNPGSNPTPAPTSTPSPTPGATPTPGNNRFACGGSVETEAWAMWDGNTYMRSYIFGERDRVINSKDVYGLYDLQIASQPLWQMAQRCGRINRLREIAAIIKSLYQALEVSPSGGRAWICRGGDICPDAGLMNKEVKLCTFQFLGLASFVANALATSGAALTAEDKSFINETALIVAEHFVRWSDAYQMEVLQNIINTPLSQITKGNEVLFSDQELWQITSYAELSGIRQWQRSQGLTENSYFTNNQTKMKNHFSSLVQAFKSRTSVRQVQAGRLPGVDLADLDRGFWRLMDGNMYSGYFGATKPVVCSPTVKVNVAASSATVGPNVGWDFSHTRRFVNAFDALERNREAMKTIFSFTEAQLPAASIPKAFAAQLVNDVWNGDKSQPLFANHWSGENGWFLAYYVNGSCDEGFAPYSMSDSFPTGGYITWAKYYPALGELGAKLYDLASTNSGASSAFMTQRYPRLSSSAGTENRAISRFMFIPTLVGVTGVVGL